MLRTTLVLFLATSLASCAEDLTILDSLHETPMAVVFGTDTVTIQAVAFRDFQPGSEVGGDSLDVGVALTGTGLPLAVTQIWVVKENELWRAAPDSMGSGRWVARGGPKWAPGSEVYVVAELTLAGAPPVRVRSPMILIEQTS